MQQKFRLWRLGSTLLLMGSLGVMGVSGPFDQFAVAPAAAQTESVPTPEQQALVAQVTVRVLTANHRGSGTLLAQQGNTYLVLTNRHVVQAQTSVTVQTVDGRQHQAKVMSDGFNDESDLALLAFDSATAYEIPELSSDFTPRPEMSILMGGDGAESGQLQIQSSQIERMLPKALQNGYQIGYGGNTVQGMSGGPIFLVQKTEEAVFYSLIGIHGVMAYSISANYRNLNGEALPPNEQAQLRQLNWGVPLLRVLERMNVQVALDYNVPLPQSEGLDGLAKSTNVGFVAELEKKAREFTVKIESSRGENGSGVIVGRNDKTYTVVTAAYVVCERAGGEDPKQPCPENQYTVVTHDGQRVVLDRRRIQIREGLDLAVLQFESDGLYPTATIANYKPQNDEPVFVAGYPKVSELQGSSWQFNPGFTFEREFGVLNVNSYALKQSQGATLSAAQSSFGEGYELVYTSQTDGGMGGGPVLDRAGQVIGIHGLAEGEAKTGDGTIQLGYSLGIPSQTLVRLLDRISLPLQNLTFSSSAPGEMNVQKQEAFNQSLVSIEAANIRRNSKGWIELGNQYWRARLYQEAIKAFDQAIAQKPDYVYLAWYGKSLTLGYSKDYQGSIEAARQATQANPNYIPAWKYLASVYHLNQEYELGLQAINTALQKQPQDPSLWIVKGSILESLKRYEEALIAINEAVRLAERPSFLFNRGLIFYRLQQYKKAIADFNQAIALDNNFVDAYFGRGNAFKELKRYEEAIADLEIAARLYSEQGNQQAYETAINLLNSLNDP